MAGGRSIRPGHAFHQLLLYPVSLTEILSSMSLEFPTIRRRLSNSHRQQIPLRAIWLESSCYTVAAVFSTSLFQNDYCLGPDRFQILLAVQISGLYKFCFQLPLI